MELIYIFIIFLFCINLSAEPGSGYCLDFPANNDYISGSNTQLPQGNSPFTMEAWFNPGSVNNASIVEYGIDNGNQRSSMLYINQRIYFSGQGNDLSGVNQFPPGTWYHFAITYNGTTLSLYVNGVFENSTNTTLGVSQQNFRIGWRMSGGIENFTGQIDEVRIWNTAISQATIRDYMCKKVTNSHPNYANLIAYFNFDQGTGITLTDLTGNGNGTFNNMTSANWQLSGAKIGNQSVYTYSNQDLTLGSVSISDVSGNSPLHLYKINETPNNDDYGEGTLYLIDDAYYGIFNDGNSTYDIEFDYSSISTVNSFLFSRDDNTSQTWTDITSTSTTQGFNRILANVTAMNEYAMVSDYVEIIDYGIPIDGNRDGVLDSTQSYVHTFLSIDKQTYITIVTDPNITIYDVENYPDESDTQFNYPFGKTEFKINTSFAEVKLYFHGITSLEGYKYRKLFSDEINRQFDNVVFSSEILDGNEIIVANLTLIDGGAGDYDGIVNGIIYDPGGPAIPVGGQIPTLSEWARIFAFCIFIGVSIWWWRREGV